jgi:hypothetical protein
MNVERLKKLADFLDNVPPEKFDMACWSNGEKPKPLDHPCKTVACAVGWATALFHDEGFVLENVVVDAYSGTMRLVPFYRYSEGWLAVTEFFELSPSDAAFLFRAPYHHSPGPREVAERIRTFIYEEELVSTT